MFGYKGGEAVKAELKKGSINQILNGTDIYEAGEFLDSIAMVVKGRIRVHGYGINLVVGSGCFLGVRDLNRGAHSVTYTAQTNAVIYVFPSSGAMSDIRKIMQINKDYVALMVSGLHRSLAEQEAAYEELQEAAQGAYELVDRVYRRCQEISKETGAYFQELPALEKLHPFDEPQMLSLDKVHYYQACAKVPMDVQKAFYGSSAEICLYHVREQVDLLHQLHDYSKSLAEYLELMMRHLILDGRNLYASVAGFALILQRADQDAGEVMSELDEVIDRINVLEGVLMKRADVESAIDRAAMEETYFNLLNPGRSTGNALDVAGDTLALVETSDIDAAELVDTLGTILAFGEIEAGEAEHFETLVGQFEALKDKESSSDEVRNLRRSLMKAYYPIYEKVFLKDFYSKEDTPVEVDLFLRYGFLSERLLREDLIEDLLALDNGGVHQNGCRVYDMKEWLQAIMNGERMPSKNEFDLDYEENLRDKVKNKEITSQQRDGLLKDSEQKLHFEVTNMFRITHRLVSGQIVSFVPFLYTEGCTALEKNFLSKEKICAAFNRLRRIDFSAFYREVLFRKEVPGIKKEFIQQEVCPDVILLPTVGSKDIMWQELSGRKRNTPGRLLLPVFMEGDLDKSVVHLTGAFRWELCRTMQGVYWNNIQYKSLTSEYSDFLQFYRKNRELSDERKEKLKLQIQKHRNNSREIFAADYSNWILHESQGGMLLSKPVREILATYCPFALELRQNLEAQPVFQNAMARYEREKGKKLREYDLKFRVWEKDHVDVPAEIIQTKEFYEK